ncbi:MAG: hypothetical protein V1492_03095 [Candidatus Micrarchaeota archaeon]
MNKGLDLNFFIILFIALAVILFIVLLPPAASEPQQPPLPKCSNTATRDCDSFGCSGTKTCINGEWDSCIVKRICRPGTVEPCIINFCASSYKTCNECGTAYGPCIPRNQT